MKHYEYKNNMRDSVECVSEIVKSWQNWGNWNETQRVALEDILYYLGQSERVQYLERENRALKAVAKNNKNLGEESLRQNKCYRQSINLALNHIHTGNFTLATVELNKALLKEVEQ